MPLLRTETGCRCKKTLVSITTTRLRRSRGAGWREMLFQTWEPRIKSPMALNRSNLEPPPLVQRRPFENVRSPVVPLAEFALEFARLVHHDLAVVSLADGVAL